MRIPSLKPHTDVPTAEQVRALRNELGWTQEQLADAAGVSPLEVSAWEAGILSVDGDAAARLERGVWFARRERAWAEADARPCAWAAKMRSRLQGSSFANPEPAARARRLLRAHSRRCDACRRAEEVESALPPIPAESPPRTLLGLTASFLAGGSHLPRPLKLLYHWTAVAVVFGATGLVFWLLSLLGDPSGAFRTWSDIILPVFVAYVALMLAEELFDDVHLAHPYPGGFLKAVTIVVPLAAVVAWTVDGVGDGVIAALGAIAALLLGVYLGWAEEDEGRLYASLAAGGFSTAARLSGERVDLEHGLPGRNLDPIRDVVEAGRYED